MNEIFIIGAGGHAKEVYSIIERISLYNFCGFIHEKEDGLFKIGNKSFKVFNEKILNNLNKNTNLVIGISKNNLLVKKIINECSDHFNFPNIIDPLSYLNYNFLNIDKGNVVFMNTIISSDISIGSFNIFNYGCVISHDVKIGDFNIFSPSVKISGNVDIGNLNYFGSNSTVLQSLKIGNNNIIGASSLITKKIKNLKKIKGIPGKEF